jgi:hypothetical protein
MHTITRHDPIPAMLGAWDSPAKQRELREDNDARDDMQALLYVQANRLAEEFKAAMQGDLSAPALFAQYVSRHYQGDKVWEVLLGALDGRDYLQRAMTILARSDEGQALIAEVAKDWGNQWAEEVVSEEPS